MGTVSAPGYAKNWPQLLCGVLTLHNCLNYMGLPNYTLCSSNYAKKGITRGIEKILTASWPTREKQEYWCCPCASGPVTALGRSAAQLPSGWRAGVTPGTATPRAGSAGAPGRGWEGKRDFPAEQRIPQRQHCNCASFGAVYARLESCSQINYLLLTALSPW